MCSKILCAFIYKEKLEIIHIYAIVLIIFFFTEKTRNDQMMSLKFLLAFIYT